MWYDSNTFSWRGERIHDYVTWAREHGDKIVVYKFKVKRPDGSFEWGFGEMPETFWDNRHFTNDGIEVERWQP